jgi:hypothetical protein
LNFLKRFIKAVVKACSRHTILDRINDDIRETQKALLSNQATADHYQALANGGLVTLARLNEMKVQEEKSAALPAAKAAPRERSPKATSQAPSAVTAAASPKTRLTRAA